MKAAALTGLAALTLLDFVSAPAAQAQSFEGAYGGVHAGIRIHDATVDHPSYPPAELSSTSASAGAHFGYNVMASPDFLIGVEADVDGSDNEADHVFDVFDGVTYRGTVESQLQATLRARAGLIMGGTLLYATAGIAFSDFEWTDSVGVSSLSHSETLTGLVVGAGAEAFISSNTIVRIEYLHEDFGTIDVPVLSSLSTAEVENTVDKVRVGVSFKF